jgi:cell division septum initiation protein DivIVA
MHVFDRRDDTTELIPEFDQVLPRFPIARQGYDCSTVDEYVAELERELGELDGEVAQLRTATPSSGEAAAEIQRLGSQTSGILIAAHDSAQEITRVAQEQADRCLADAASNALAITSDANQQVSDLQSRIDSLCEERDRILKDVRRAADALKSLAGEAPDVLLSAADRAG